MNGLAPPATAVAPTPALEVGVPPEGIKRDVVLAAYQAAMPRPVPDSKALTLALRGWSGILGRAEWFRGTRNRTAALAMHSPSVQSDRDTCDAVVSAVAEFVDPLARYSAGWCDALTALDPRAQRKPISDAVREARRYGAQCVRDDMAAAEPRVPATEASLRGFLDDPSRRHTRDEQIAINAFATKIAKIIDLDGTTKARLSDDEREALTELEARLSDDFDARPDRIPTDEELADYRRIAVAVVERAFAQTDLRRTPHHHVSEAFGRLVTTAVNRQIKGIPLDDLAQWVRPRIRAVRIGEDRRLRRQGKTEKPLDPSGDPMTRHGTDPRTASDSADRAADIVEISIDLIESDTSLFSTAEHGLCWEARRALSLLNSPDDGLTETDLRSSIADAWLTESPTDSRAASPDAAALDVLLILRTTTTRAMAQFDGIDEEAGA